MLSQALRSFMSAFLLVIAASIPCAAAGAPVKITTRVIEERKPTHEIKISYPVTGVRRIDDEIAAWAKGLAGEFRRSAADAAAGGDIGSMSWSSELSYAVKRNDGDVLSLVFTHYTFTGGAHPNSSFRTFHFLISDGMNAEIAQLFSARGIRRISDLSINQLKAKLGGPDGMSDGDWIRRGAGPNPANFSRFILQPGSLTVLFDAYQVAAYAAGPQEVRIPIAKLRDTLRPDPRVPAASFECANARSAVEVAICSSHDLSRQDRRLAEAYAERLTWAEDEAQVAALRQAQRDWLRRRDTACQGLGDKLTRCLSSLYQSRIEELSPGAAR